MITQTFWLNSHVLKDNQYGFWNSQKNNQNQPWGTFCVLSTVDVLCIGFP